MSEESNLDKIDCPVILCGECEVVFPRNVERAEVYKDGFRLEEWKRPSHCGETWVEKMAGSGLHRVVMYYEGDAPSLTLALPQ